MEALSDHAVSLQKEVDEKDRIVSDLSHTVGALIDNPVKRPAGRPQLRGPDTHEKQIKDLRVEQTSKTKRANGAKKK